mgnify:CR=1 FL=1
MDKACNLIKKGVKWCCYTILTVFIGLNAIKSILTPVQDTVNSKGIFMGISLIPGIGDTAQVLIQYDTFIFCINKKCNRCVGNYCYCYVYVLSVAADWSSCGYISGDCCRTTANK